METFAQITEALLPVLVTIVTGVVAVLGRALHRWLNQKFELERFITEREAVDALLGLVDDAVDYADQWARKQPDPPEGHEKLLAAVDFVIREANERGLTEYARDRIIDLVEARLGRKKREDVQ